MLKDARVSSRESHTKTHYPVTCYKQILTVNEKHEGVTTSGSSTRAKLMSGAGGVWPGLPARPHASQTWIVGLWGAFPLEGNTGSYEKKNEE